MPQGARDVRQPDALAWYSEAEQPSEEQPESSDTEHAEPRAAEATPDGAATTQTPAPAPAQSSGLAQTPMPSNRQFYIAHGRDREALGQLQSILKGLEIPYVVAEEEANPGRPISQEIADLMRSCSAGIFVFSGDEEVRGPDGTTVRRPRPNVVFELGAASFQYGQRIVIFKEQGVEFPHRLSRPRLHRREGSAASQVNGTAP